MLDTKHILSRLEEHFRHYLLYPLRRLMARLRGEYSPGTIPLAWSESPSRIEFLNAICRRTQVRGYLEIGCWKNECFAHIDAPRKVGVDPHRGGTVQTTSDAFFEGNTERFDLVFIDGLHHHVQVLRDIKGALAALNPGGVIVLHDCLPLTCEAQYRQQSTRFWNGDVWKAVVEVRAWPEVDTATCLVDHGLAIIRPRPNTWVLTRPDGTPQKLSFDLLLRDYPRLLRTLDYEAGLQFATADISPPLER